MDETPELTRLINRIRAGDESAITELIRDHEPLVISAVQFALEPGNSLRPFITTQDILQSVNGRLVRESRKGQVAVATNQPPAEELSNGMGWLITVATHLVIDKSRRFQPNRDDDADTSGDGVPADHGPKGGPNNRPKMITLEAVAEIFAGADPEPGKRLADREMVQRILAQLSPAERAAAEARMAGHSWEEIGKQWERPMQRRFQQLRDQFQEPNDPPSE